MSNDLIEQLRDLRERFIFQGGSEFAVRLAKRIEDLEKTVEFQRAAWGAEHQEIANLQAEVDAEEKRFNDLLDDFDWVVKERDRLREQVKMYEQALKASWPEGATGEAFDFWNAARKVRQTKSQEAA